MFKFRVATVIRALLMLFALGAFSELMLSDQASARAGGGRRSMGRSFQSAPPARAPMRQQPAVNPSSQPQGQAMPAQPRGGFMRGLAGGIAGGFLGSMLFSSLGHASGAGGLGGGGGIGILEIILLAGVAFLAFRWWRNRQMSLAGASNAGGYASFSRDQTPASASYGGSPSLADQGAFASSLQAGPQITEEQASDIFFKVQGAWTRRNLQSVRHLLGPEMAQTLQQDIDELLRSRRINRLENISIRGVEVGDRWQEGGSDLCRARLRANLLDYTVDEASNQVVSGSDSEPVKFEEDWTFARGLDGQWQLVSIQQLDA